MYNKTLVLLKKQNPYIKCYYKYYYFTSKSDSIVRTVLTKMHTYT